MRTKIQEVRRATSENQQEMNDSEEDDDDNKREEEDDCNQNCNQSGSDGGKR